MWLRRTGPPTSVWLTPGARSTRLAGGTLTHAAIVGQPVTARSVAVDDLVYAVSVSRAVPLVRCS
jgi:hypothetical protein